MGTRNTDYSIWRVITASSVGTMIEWYDFYIFGSLAAILGPKFYPPGNDTFAYVAYLATFAVGFLVRPFGALLPGRLSRNGLAFGVSKNMPPPPRTTIPLSNFG